MKSLIFYLDYVDNTNLNHFFVKQSDIGVHHQNLLKTVELILYKIKSIIKLQDRALVNSIILQKYKVNI